MVDILGILNTAWPLVRAAAVGKGWSQARQRVEVAKILKGRLAAVGKRLTPAQTKDWIDKSLGLYRDPYVRTTGVGGETILTLPDELVPSLEVGGPAAMPIGVDLRERTGEFVAGVV